MKIANTRFKKAILIVTGSLLIAVVLIILLISPIAKYLVEKYSEKLSGRQIRMSWMYLNPFTGYVHISNLKIYESRKVPAFRNGDSVFFSADGVSANFAMLKLLSKTIEITEITVNHPKGIIIQNKNVLNFSDLITLFTPENHLLNPSYIKPKTVPKPYHFNIHSIKIVNGEFHYREEVTPVTYYIKDVNLESTGKLWNADTMAIKFSFLSGPDTGSAKGTFRINFNSLEYRLSAIVNRYDLKFMEQYLKELINYGNFRANLDADINSTGNFNDPEDIDAHGVVAVNDFHFGKNEQEDYAAWDKLVLKIDELNPRNHQYVFDSVSLNHPFFKYERYDSLDNLQRMFGKNGSNLSAANSDPAHFNLIIEIAHYVKILATNFFQSEYKINRLAIYKADFKYNDFAISEKFSAALNPLYFIADSINKTHKRVNASLRSGILPYGNITATLSINPNDKGDFDLKYHLLRVPATLFNPYLVSFTSYPLDRGTLEFKGTWNVRNDNIESVNHLIILDPRVTKRLRNKDTKWIPMPLIMAFIRERGNVIDYEIPITGSLKNPKFHLHDVLMDLLSNIFVKPATTPYRMEVKNVENEIEKSLTLKWKMRQSTLQPDQVDFVNTIVDFLIKNPDASISVYPMQYASKEKEQIQFFEAKKKYFLLSKDKNAQFSNDADSLQVDKMSVKDPSFVRYMNKKNNNSMLFTIQEKCNKYIGSAIVDARFNRLTKGRENAFTLPFKNKNTQNRVVMHSGENVIPFNGYSFYKIVYKGEIPESLIKSFRKMNELNDETPRKQYKNERKKNKNTLSQIAPK